MKSKARTIPEWTDAITMDSFEYFNRTGIHTENTYWQIEYEYDPVLDALLAPYRRWPEPALPDLDD